MKECLSNVNQGKKRIVEMGSHRYCVKAACLCLTHPKRDRDAMSFQNRIELVFHLKESNRSATSLQVLV